jgi:hypothetical protein
VARPPAKHPGLSNNTYPFPQGSGAEE